MNFNSIGADGTPIFGFQDIENNLSFTNSSTMVGENAGDGIDKNVLRNNILNTFVGFSSGEKALNSYLNTFIGSYSGKNVSEGSNSIIIGKSSGEKKTYDIISLGNENITQNNCITIGHLNNNNGYANYVAGKKNYVKGTNISCVGNRNNVSANNSLIYGNYNGPVGDGLESCNLIIIGNSNLSSINNNFTQLMKSNPILIGNNLSDNNAFTVNIGDTFVKYDDYVEKEVVFIGLDKKYEILQTAIGFKEDDIETSNILYSSNTVDTEIDLYVKNGIQASHLTLIDTNITSNELTSSSITISISSNISSNIHYVLPDYPNVPDNMFLTVDGNGEMYWKNVSNNVGGDFSDEIFDERFAIKVSELSLDDIQNGANNNYIKNGIYNRDLVIFGTLTVNKLRVLGVNMKQDATFDDYINNLVDAKIFDWEKTVDDNVSLLNSKIDSLEINTSNHIANVVDNLRWFLETSDSMTENISRLAMKESLANDNVFFRTFNVSIMNNDVLTHSLCVNVSYTGSTVSFVSFQLFYTKPNSGTITRYQTSIIHGVNIGGNKIGFYNNMVDILLLQGNNLTIMSI